MVKVKVIETWLEDDGKNLYWWSKDMIINVRSYAYRATKCGTLNYCYCSECAKDRSGKKLYDMYEVISGEKRGSIIPRIVCKVISNEKH